MALLTDDMDIHTNHLYMDLDGNGDYYINMVIESDGLKHCHSMRIATSGGNAPTEVKIAVAELFRALEKHNLNSFPK